ncbi:hypothetical protein D5018_06685 [Parashewanella curva]|uniref:Lipoprotein n=1 Tax=Parashewanella curva TaxID=2338552 RepID=A0A3L8Q182_9GAMM|nr:YajG family lipoprotein [Parashewanella curva]RLV60473.1 hypothetical protein D5018_06685 [Parashewanella curva]
MKTRALLFMLITTLAGCASTAPTQIVLSPTVPQFTSANIEVPIVSLQVIDRRKANFIVRQDDSKSENRLVAPSEPPSTLIEQALTQTLKNSGTAIAPHASTAITIYIDELLANVTQETFKYKVDSKVSLSLQVKKGRHSYTNSYQVTGNMNGSLQLDYSQLELALNKLINQVTSDLINDPKLIMFINSKTG